ncbi:MAG: XRE family transcriptional regulator [Pseudomonadota bacterium]
MSRDFLVDDEKLRQAAEIAGRIEDLARERRKPKEGWKAYLRRVGISHTTVRRWATGTQGADLDTLERYAAVLGVPLDELRYGQETAQPSDTVRPFVELIRVPLYEERVAANVQGRCIDEADVEQYVEVPRAWIAALKCSRELAVVRVSDRGDGESMRPTILPGEMVLVDTLQGQDIERFIPGEIYCVRMEDGAAIKRVEVKPPLPDDEESGGFILKSDNRTMKTAGGKRVPKYPDVVVTWAETLTELVVGRVLCTLGPRVLMRGSTVVLSALLTEASAAE